MVIQPVDRFWERADIAAVTDLCLQHEMWHHVVVGARNASYLFDLKATKQGKPEIYLVDQLDSGGILNVWHLPTLLGCQL